ncbi:MAG: DUF4145 domain-containing protein [Chloroflexi bacterium]|nr:DUF4145 domain-containing protein [Chloroflexota bacterium]
MKLIKCQGPHGKTAEVAIDWLPDTCPHCERGVDFQPLISLIDAEESFIELFFKCPRNNCRKYSAAFYEHIGSTPISGKTEYFHGPDIEVPLFSLIYALPDKPIKSRVFEDQIIKISPSFVEIYNQAYASEQQGLDQICGMGYRKALEFLIKDFLTGEKPESSKDIQNELLGRCINKYIDEPRIKMAAEKATWLGNDETHYVRKWEDKDIEDLKILVDLTLYWISSHLLTKKYNKEMS